MLVVGPDRFVPQALVGPKAHNVRLLRRLGFAVPVPICLTTEAFRDFLDRNGLRAMIQSHAERIRAGATPADLENLRRAIASAALPAEQAAGVKQLLDQHCPEARLFAVRSSATNEDGSERSAAGRYHTSLNVRIADLSHHIAACYASLFDRDNLDRYVAPGNEAVPEMAVLVMPMIEAVAAGVIFTADPVTGNRNRLVIESTAGLGDAVVRGVANVERYTVRSTFGERQLSIDVHSPPRVRERSALPEAGFRALSAENALRLAKLAQRIEDSVGNFENPQDIEWAADPNELWILQCRPITALPVYTYAGLQGQPTYWSDANLREIAPEVHSALSWSMCAPLFEEMLTASCKVAAYRGDPDVRHIATMGGRVYMNISALQWEWHEAFGAPPSAITAAIGGEHGDIAVPHLTRFKACSAWVRRCYHITRLLFGAVRTLSSQERVIKRTLARPPQVITHYEEPTVRTLLASVGAIAFRLQLINNLSGFAVLAFERLYRALRPGATDGECNSLLGSASHVVSAEVGWRLVELRQLMEEDSAAAEYLQAVGSPSRITVTDLPHGPLRTALEVFLTHHGHRCVNELELRNPRWAEDPTYLIELIRTGLLEVPTGRGRRPRSTSVPAVPYIIRRGASLTAGLLDLRERTKSTVLRLLKDLRACCVAAGRQLRDLGVLLDADDVFLMSRWEVNRALAGELSRDEVAELLNLRRLMEREHRMKRRIHVFCAPSSQSPVEQVASFGREYSKHRSAWVGLPVSPGRVRGRVCKLESPTEFKNMIKADIIVASSLDTPWAPLLIAAAGVIADTGGALSHGAIIAREYGVPTVVNAIGAFAALRTGDIVELDGGAGTIKLITTDGAGEMLPAKDVRL